jgi:hypothetical protein
MVLGSGLISRMVFSESASPPPPQASSPRNYDFYKARREIHIRRRLGWRIPCHSASAILLPVTTAHHPFFQFIWGIVYSDASLCSELREGSGAFEGFGASRFHAYLPPTPTNPTAH